MGTNYYLHEPQPDACPHCGHAPDYEPLHIGKSSAGWCFSLHVIPEEGINTLEDWQQRWSKPRAFIRNEYGESVPTDEMLELITERQWTPGTWNPARLAANHAIQGPNHLARHNGMNCAGHGPGTYDYITGWFS